jgi:deoxyribodipyrimidine photo-lyase
LELAEQWKIKNVFCNLEYEPDELRREARLVQMMLDQGINFDPQHDDCVVPPGTLKTGGGKQYAVYTPWFRAWTAYLHGHSDLLNERPMPPPNSTGFQKKFKQIFEMAIPSLPESKSITKEEEARLHALWPAGEAAAIDRLERFLTEKVGKYQATRNYPSKNSTACVSVHHAAGTLAARTSVRMARDINSTKRLDGGNEGIKGWISEVAWRDFYRHVLVHWPYIW